METAKREIWVDWLRVLACFLVMVVHSSEPFYLNGYDTFVLSRSDLMWASFIDSFSRMSVPLFVIASAYLLFPLRCSAGEFLRKRASRILIPFAIWSVIYAVSFGNAWSNLSSLLLNFNFTASHLWFIYMLLGIYLMMPLLSPWAREVSRKELSVYIAMWLLATTLPLVRDLMSQGKVSFIMGPTYIPRQAEYPLWGECSWNAYGTFYYISGCIGYLFVSLYLRKFSKERNWGRTLSIALPLMLVGLAVVEGGYLAKTLAMCGGEFPAKGSWGDTIWIETTWHNDTFGVALMTIGAVMLIRKIKCDGWLYNKVILPVSKVSYGMYLMHLILLPHVSSMLRGTMPTPLVIIVTAAVTFIITAMVSMVIRKIPKVGRCIIG